MASIDSGISLVKEATLQAKKDKTKGITAAGVKKAAQVSAV